MNRPTALLSGLLLLAGGAVGARHQGVGYDDTPQLPGQRYRVHDSRRVPPPVVTPGEAGAPPSDAIVLFDGEDLSEWEGGPWRLVDGAMVVNGTGSIRTRRSFGDCQLHLEWAAPAEVVSESQGRGNSGVILQGRYEVQVLDSHENVTYADGQAAALYGQYPPLRNASRPPGEWQTYDILFEAPEFEGDRCVSPARVTVLHNGVAVHHAQPLIGAVAHRAVGTYAPHGPAPLVLQDHGNPVRYRNVWIRELGEYDRP
jgi:hypothetical protein